MREILFRGQDIKTKKWVEGFLFGNIDGWDKPHYYIQYFYQSLPIEVIPETISQYTGLTDKNGNKIFDGDIAKCIDIHNKLEFMAVIEFGNPNCYNSWGWQFRRIKGDYPNLDILLWIEQEDTGAYAEIIGNIWDSPSLLTHNI